MLNVKVNNSIEDRNVQNIFLKRELCQSLVILDGPQNHFRRHTFQHRYYHLGKLHYFIRGRNLFGLSYLSNNSKFKKMQLLPFPRYNCLLRYSPFGVFSCFNRYITIVTSPTNLEKGFVKVNKLIDRECYHLQSDAFLFISQLIFIYLFFY